MPSLRDKDLGEMSLGEVLLVAAVAAPAGFVITILAGFIKTGTEVLDDGFGGLVLIGVGGALIFEFALVLMLVWEKLWRRFPY